MIQYISIYIFLFLFSYLIYKFYNRKSPIKEFKLDERINEQLIREFSDI